MIKSIKSGLISSAIILLTVALVFYIFPIANTGWFSFHVHAQGAGGPVELACPNGTVPLSNSGTSFNQSTQKYRQWLCVDPFGNIQITTTALNGNTTIIGPILTVGNPGASAGSITIIGTGSGANLNASGSQLGNNTLLWAGPGIAAGALASSGSISLSGTGACASLSGTIGGQWNGLTTCTGGTAASTLIISGLPTATHGYNCFGSDITHTLAGSESVTSTTGCTLSFTSVTTSDQVSITAFAY